MQYQTGTVAVTNGNNAVVGTGTKWLTDSNPVVVGDEFVVLGTNAFYQVASVVDDTHLTLTTPYTTSATAAGLAYYIIRDYTTLGLPVLQRGDVDVANVVARMTRSVDVLLQARLPLAGGTMTGALTINRNAASPLPADFANTALRVVGVDGVTVRSSLESFGNSVLIGAIRYNGTGVAPTAVLANQLLVGFQSAGFDGTAVGTAGSIQYMSTENWTTGAHGSMVKVFVNKNGTITATVPSLQILNTSDVALGLPSLVATATGGFLLVPNISGPPTGVPTGLTGYVPLAVDPVNNKLWMYNGAAWKSATFS